MKTFCLLFLFLPAFMHAQIITPTYANVSYVNDTSIKHKMDVFIPPGVNSALPCVVHIHGGGFGAGQKGEALPSLYYPSGTTFCDSLYYHGYVIADINYRLSSDTLFPGPVYDCKTAIRFLRMNAETYFVDTCKMGVIGESAGGYFVDILGTSGDVSSLEGKHLGSGEVTSRVQAVLSMYATTDFNYFDTYYPNIPPDSCSPYPCCWNDNINNPIGKFLGCSISSCPELVAQSSVLTYIDGNEPPFDIWHGTKDCTVPPIQSLLLYDSLIVHGGDAVWHSILHGTHSDASFFTDSFRHNVRVFFDAKLMNGEGCQPTSENNFPFHSGIKIFPNPASDMVHVKVSSPCNQPFVFCVFGLLGNEIASYHFLSQNIFSFPTKNYRSGIYFYRATNPINGENLNGKLTISK
ncbi:MAG TPA: alpha/beta hydrolase fold domain-containing protein [Chitinophagales bacterium]|nr:alpha/beta hydrolase fold domain-containing protein [Chitinophagales bacterium]